MSNVLSLVSRKVLEVSDKERLHYGKLIQPCVSRAQKHSRKYRCNRYKNYQKDAFQAVGHSGPIPGSFFAAINFLVYHLLCFSHNSFHLVHFSVQILKLRVDFRGRVAGLKQCNYFRVPYDRNLTRVSLPEFHFL